MLYNQIIFHSTFCRYKVCHKRLWTSAPTGPPAVLMRITAAIISWNEYQAWINFISSLKRYAGTTGSLYGRGSCASDSEGPLSCLRDIQDNGYRWVWLLEANVGFPKLNLSSELKSSLLSL